MKRSKTTDRLLAAAMGVAIAAALVGGLAYWGATYVHGTEACKRCDMARTHDRRGPFAWYSEPAPGHWHMSGPLRVSPCAEHEWVRVSCWRVGGMIACYRGVKP